MLGAMTISKETEAETPEPAREREVTNSVSPAKAAKEKPHPVSKKIHVVSGGDTDTVATSALVTNPLARKSLSVHHLQRRLAEEGHHEAAADRDGFLGELTASATRSWQKSLGYEETGYLTIAQARQLFANDPNVNLFVDTIEV